MWCEIFIRLLLAHVIGDFLFQTQKWCAEKLGQGLRCKALYFHSGIILILSWIAIWSWSAWWIAVIIGLSHLLIDALKKKNNLCSFVLDQLAHIICLIIIAYITGLLLENGMVVYGTVPLEANAILYALVFLVNAKPSNILIKHLLYAYSVRNKNSDCIGKNSNDEIKSGKLIGNIERWLIIIFVLCGQYDAIGFLIAAKSIIRYKEGDTEKTEYVLTGTLLSVFIAVISGLFLKLNIFVS